jgi:beta-1,4-N-acetylglucosaminyltransferase
MGWSVMRVFVTVGTTDFDELIESIDLIINDDIEFTCQIAKGKYKPKNHTYFSFTDDIHPFYEKADVIITHAGAGSIYKLLEIGKKIIVCPNLFRKDKHQAQIAKYVEENNFAMACYNLKEIQSILLCTDFSNLTTYSKTDFFGHKILLS